MRHVCWTVAFAGENQAVSRRAFTHRPQRFQDGCKRPRSAFCFLPLSLECRSAPCAVKSLRFAPRLLHFVPALRVTAPGASLRGRLKRKKTTENHLLTCPIMFLIRQVVEVGSLLSRRAGSSSSIENALLVNPPSIPDNPARPELRLSLAAPIMCSSFHL